MVSYIFEANVQYNNVIEYESWEGIIIPVFEIIEDVSTLAPWRRKMKFTLKLRQLLK